MNKKIILTVFLSFVGIISYERLTPHTKIINQCLNSHDENSFSHCLNNDNLSAQNKYDIFYKNYDKFNTESFFSLFSQSWNQCVIRNSFKHDCYLRDEPHYVYNAKICAQNGGLNCSSNYLMHNHSEEGRMIFENLVIKNKSCINLSGYYLTIYKEESKPLNPVVQEICNRQSKIKQLK